MTLRRLAAVALAALPLLCLASMPVMADDAPAAKPAASGVLKAGDAAPEIAVSKWVKGAPVEGFVKGKAYVIEFWATWCGPCIAGMPHLSELQRHYADQGLTVIGMTDPDPNNSLERVEAMVTDKGDGMAYTVAWTLVDPESKLARRDLDLALEAASAANALTGGKDAATLDTLARVYSWKGDLTRAIAIQEKALALAKGTPMGDGIRAALEEYRAASK